MNKKTKHIEAFGKYCTNGDIHYNHRGEPNGKHGHGHWPLDTDTIDYGSG